MSPPHNDKSLKEFDQQLNDAYLRAEYWAGDFCLKIGHPAPKLDAWLRAHGHSHYAFITPCNPRSQVISDEKNTERLNELRDLLNMFRLDFLPATGRDPQGEWPDEPGFLVFDIPLSVLHDVARGYEQNAVVEGRLRGVPLLVWL
ncbi:DUF3293 domain-containing protein [Lewinella sp. W8]|uniref:DUF3293 domain-containing protein n=1 Tax=Lewinella sp. W8 TaxID=2528208 RepID=UPI001067849A|nr:DUF3293 domain-containing protein [Lewinella sp. W8]MTB51490.1 DUF3293 domain-containing protein [Lewinella sp. W8]